jgi:hypothetical protein
MILRNVGSRKSHTASHSRRRNSSSTHCLRIQLSTECSRESHTGFITKQEMREGTYKREARIKVAHENVRDGVLGFM